MKLSIIFGLLSLLVYPSSEPLTIHIEGCSTSSAQIIASIYQKDNYLEEEPYLEVKQTLSNNSKVMILSDLPDGEYSIFLFEDHNLNGELDFNLVGIPKESFGFSKNPKLRFKAPTFTQTSFTKKGAHDLKIQLKRY